MTDRRRNLFILLLVARAADRVAASSIATKPTRLGLDLKGGVELVYQAKPTHSSRRSRSDAIDRAIDIMRERVDQLGVAEPEIQRSGADQIDVGAARTSRTPTRPRSQVGTTAQLYFYDWETNVLGADGKPTPADAERHRRLVGRARASARPTHYDAVTRAAKCPRRTTPERHDQRALLPRRHEGQEGPRRPGRDRGRTCARRSQNKGIKPDADAEGRRGQAGHGRRPRRAVAGRARAKPATSYYVLNDNPALERHRHQEPRAELRQRRRRHRRADRHLRLHGQGPQGVAEDHARDRPARPASSSSRATTRATAFQHFAIVLDNELISRPVHRLPAEPGRHRRRATARRSRAASRSSRAQDLANLLKTGALPIKLEADLRSRRSRRRSASRRCTRA